MTNSSMDLISSPSHELRQATRATFLIEGGFERLLELLERQLSNMFQYDQAEDREHLLAGLNLAMSRTQLCFSHIELKRYHHEGACLFNPFHSGQYCIFLYYLSHALARQGAMNLADRVYYLNRALNSVDLFHQVNLPDVFCVEHPLGSVIGRAQIGDFFFFSQGVTVGGNKNEYPVIGRYVSMLSNSKVIGKSVIGDNVILSANSYVKDAIIPSNSIVFGQDRQLIIKENKGQLMTAVFSTNAT